jgi:hypothetical protein
VVDYRLYYHDDLPVMRSKDFRAPSDAQAIGVARAMKKTINCQLWSVDRFVATVAAYRGHERDQ